MKLKWLFTLLAMSVLVQQCAKQTAPTGGPKDIAPPILIKSDPANKEVNFKGKDLKLTFDELIQLNNAREQLIITPSIGKKLEVTSRKNTVTLTFNADLVDNTTYTINFRESIQDLNERNPANIKLAFSTGPYIDSLRVTGIVTERLMDNPQKNYTVALVSASDTFNIFKHTASWITVADKQGKFEVENLKPGKYFLYTFDDKNRNLIVDSKSEKYGFSSDLINLPEKSDSIELSVFKQDASKLKLISSRPTFAYYNIRFSKSLVSYKLTQETKPTIFSVLEPDLTTIKVFNTIPDLDSLQVRLEATDSTDSSVDTLIYIKFPKKDATKDKFTAAIESANHVENKSLLSSTITFSKPVIHFNADSIYVQVDSVTRISFTKEDFQWNENLTKLKISKKIDSRILMPAVPTEDPKQPSQSRTKKVQKINQLIVTKGSMISIENDSVAVMTKPVKDIVPADIGVITCKVQTKEDFILQLLDKNNKVYEETKNSKNHTFDNIPPGTYALRVLIDLNKNGKWDAGNFLTKKQPEPVIYYHNPKGGKDIFLKANWELNSLLISY